MLRFKRYIKEARRLNLYYVDVFVNPPVSQIKSMLQKMQGVRLMQDIQTKEWLAWDAMNATHYDVAEELGDPQTAYDCRVELQLHDKKILILGERNKFINSPYRKRLKLATHQGMTPFFQFETVSLREFQIRMQDGLWNKHRNDRRDFHVLDLGATIQYSPTTKEGERWAKAHLQTGFFKGHYLIPKRRQRPVEGRMKMDGLKVESVNLLETNVQNFVVAIKSGGKIYKGKKGEGHYHIVSTQDIDYDKDTVEGFYDTVHRRFYDRRQMADLTKHMDMKKYAKRYYNKQGLPYRAKGRGPAFGIDDHGDLNMVQKVGDDHV